MKIAAMYCVYNEAEYIEYSIRSIYDFVDRVFVLVGELPYSAYNERAREQFQTRDETTAMVATLARHLPKITLLTGRWESEIAHRNAGLRLCVEEQHRYSFLVDGDEVYRSDHLEALREEIQAHPEVGTFHIKCTIFWRSFHYRIRPDVMKWMPPRVFKIDRHRKMLGVPLPHRMRFVGKNKTNSLGPKYLVPPERCTFYHFSYARSEEKMRQKIATFSVARDVMSGWFERVWLAWPSQRDMREIHPMTPEEFPQADRVEPTDLPEVMKTHPYYQLDVIR